MSRRKVMRLGLGTPAPTSHSTTFFAIPSRPPSAFAGELLPATSTSPIEQKTIQPTRIVEAGRESRDGKSVGRCWFAASRPALVGGGIFTVGMSVSLGGGSLGLGPRPPLQAGSPRLRTRPPKREQAEQDRQDRPSHAPPLWASHACNNPKTGAQRTVPWDELRFTVHAPFCFPRIRLICAHKGGTSPCA